MYSNSQTKLNIFSLKEIDEAIDYVVVKKCLKVNGVLITVSVNDVSRVLAEKFNLDPKDIGLRTQVGKRLSYLKKRGLLELVRHKPCCKYRVTSRFFEARFGFRYKSLRSRPLFYLTPVEITYLLLKEGEGGK